MRLPGLGSQPFLRPTALLNGTSLGTSLAQGAKRPATGRCSEGMGRYQPHSHDSEMCFWRMWKEAANRSMLNKHGSAAAPWPGFEMVQGPKRPPTGRCSESVGRYLPHSHDSEMRFWRTWKEAANRAMLKTHGSASAPWPGFGMVHLAQGPKRPPTGRCAKTHGSISAPQPRFGMVFFALAPDPPETPRLILWLPSFQTSGQRFQFL